MIWIEELTVIKMEKVTSSIVKRRYFPERMFHTSSSHDLRGILLVMNTVTTDNCYHSAKEPPPRFNLGHDDYDYIQHSGHLAASRFPCCVLLALSWNTNK